MFITKQKVAAVLIAFALVAFGLPVTSAYANPTYVGPKVQTSSATTSPTYMTPGTATTTLIYDSQVPTTNVFTPNFAVLLTRFAASSTASVLGIAFEYSNDGIDYYKDSLISPNSPGTTSPIFDLGPTNQMSWKFASSTLAGAAVNAVSGAISTRAVIVPTPLRFTRVVYTLLGGNAAIWAEIIPIKETQF